MNATWWGSRCGGILRDMAEHLHSLLQESALYRRQVTNIPKSGGRNSVCKSEFQNLTHAIVLEDFKSFHVGGCNGPGFRAVHEH